MPEENTGAESTDAAAAAETSESSPDAGRDLEAEAAKWKAMARKHESQAKANASAAKRLAEIEDEKKSETERLTEAQKQLEKRAVDAEARALRYEVALEKGVPTKLMKFLTGESQEDIEAAADELLEAISDKESQTDNGGKPKERLRAGAVSDDTDPEVTDPRKLAEQIPRGGW